MNAVEPQLLTNVEIRRGRESDTRTSSVKRAFEIYLKYIANLYLLEFLGANILDDKPFIVMPYLKHGNVRAYLKAHPDDNRLQIVCLPMIPDWELVFIFHMQLHGISLGLVYLHSYQIVHGDLKAVS
jgi:serine/threonine protein kinase